MAVGGKRPGAGAPKRNQNNLKHGVYSKAISDPETRAAFDRHLALLKKDPLSAMLANAAVIQAQVERVMRSVDSEGFMHIETVDNTSEHGGTTTKRVEITEPISRALERAARITVAAHEIEAKRRGMDLAGQDSVIRVIVPALTKAE